MESLVGCVVPLDVMARLSYNILHRPKSVKLARPRSCEREATPQGPAPQCELEEVAQGLDEARLEVLA